MIQSVLFGMEQAAKTSDDYYTPAWVFERMGIDFDLDVCAPPGGLPWIPAARYFTMADDGLAQEWYGRVWMNPPYSDSAPWAARWLSHRHGVALLPLTKSQWCQAVMETIDGFVYAPANFAFTTHLPPKGHVRPGEIIWPVFFAAFGHECVDAISRLGRVRR